VSTKQEISIHDNRLVSYEVFCERREICLRTEFRDRGEPFELTDVFFTGVAAYDFWHDSDIGTIIFDITEVPAVDIYAEHADQFREGVRYGWPGDWADSAETAASFFVGHGIRGFELASSCGMSGWVLARDMKMETRAGSSIAQPCAAPNGGPATQLGNSGVSEGPPSVS
jgi:hypothetical protein